MPENEASNAVGNSARQPRKSRKGKTCRPRAQLIADIELLSYSDHLEGIARRLDIAPEYVGEVLRDAGKHALLAAITLRPVGEEVSAA